MIDKIQYVKKLGHIKKIVGHRPLIFPKIGWAGGFLYFLLMFDIAIKLMYQRYKRTQTAHFI